MPVGHDQRDLAQRILPCSAARDRQAGAGVAQCGADGRVRLLRAAVRHAVAPVAARLAGIDLPGFNMSRAGLVMGIMIIPYIASLSEDAMRAVPMHMREGSYAMGATRMQTALRVVVPAAFSGITAAYILGMSRAIGETMIVAIAAGQQPQLTLDPLSQGMTITAYIVQISKGDMPHGSIEYHSIFAAGLTLMLLTLVFNVAGYLIRKRYREVYS